MANERSDKALLKAQNDLLDAQISGFSGALDSFLFKQLSKLLNPAAKIKDPLAMIQVLESLGPALEQAGLANVLSKLDSIYGKQLEFVVQTFDRVGKKASFSDIDSAVIEQLIGYDVELVTSRISQYLADVKRTFQIGVLSGDLRPFDEVHDNLAGTLTGTVETELNTALQGFSRTVTISKSKELGFELYRYIGPDDDVTREFCEDLLAKSPAIYTLSEIENMDNGEGLPVITFGGGYNCRHQWRPISIEQAQERGYAG